MDWTVIGAEPPTRTDPTAIWREARLRAKVDAAGGGAQTLI
jgi:hypothetical protein